MAVKIAFYKGSGSFLDKVIRWWEIGRYAHCEMILQENDDGTYTIASAKPGVGVRIAENQSLPDSDWDFLTVPGDVSQVRAWFVAHAGESYDYVGLLGFILRPVTFFIRKKFFCSRACLRSLGVKGAWRVDPNGMYDFMSFCAQFAR
ncbi:hypothetical protein AWB81_04197 [Caballeronia arationis]|uniref:hypothetical protein n=1 Tax=Caballeronia arationis TaxID=1777142 RepID=UPI00074C58C9|nr:hypothetical protein [Caballeronia arationis]SAK83319.1 hypothetical protein AWB81_04197 [Caballeronia arationis]